MKPYRNLSGDAGVEEYEYGPKWIRIHFSGDGVYEYITASVGAAHLKMMKHLADDGDGLTTYINQHSEVRKGYSRRVE